MADSLNSNGNLPVGPATTRAYFREKEEARKKRLAKEAKAAEKQRKKDEKRRKKEAEKMDNEKSK